MFSTENYTESRLMSNRAHAVRMARRILDADDLLVIDTETTGLDDYAEICELAIIDRAGDVLVDTRIKPRYGIPDDVSRIHGITDADVVGAPTIGAALRDDLLKLLKTGTIAIYNKDFDLRLIRQSGAAAERLDIMNIAMAVYRQAHCVMRLYARFWGDWSEYHGSYTWQSLGAAAAQCGLEWDGDAHRALADARMTLAVLRFMAEQNDSGGD